MRNDEGGDVDFLREGVRVLAQALMEVAYISTAWGVTRIPAHIPWSSEAFPATRHQTAAGQLHCGRRRWAHPVVRRPQPVGGSTVHAVIWSRRTRQLPA